MSATDSTANAIRVYKTAGLSDSTYMQYREQADLVTKRVSDNLGAYMSALFKLGELSNADNDIQFYYSPSVEFVWRRTQTTNAFSNGRNRDSSIVKGTNRGVMEMASKYTIYANEYNFNAGILGFFLVHENKQISMRLHCNAGYSSLYLPHSVTGSITDNNIQYRRIGDIFFTGRAWITEASSGITLQAEVTNTFKNPRPFFGVTLSKALNFKSFGSFFNPVTAR